MSRVAVALSGGVDSSVAALLLAEQGFSLVGVTLRLLDGAAGPAGEAAVQSAAAVCEKLGLSHEIIDLRAEFEQQVIAPFVAAYAAGLTPNPCLRCNRLIKWGALRRAAEALDCPLLATGHYARIAWAEGRHRLQRGRDRHKDQSYALYSLRPADLRQTLFPVGELTKPRLRELAAAAGLPVATRAESQDICFLPGGDYRALLGPQARQPGEIVDTAGRVRGQHRGLGGYTVGQRKGLGIAAEARLYVVALDPTHNRLIVGSEAEACVRECRLREVNWSSPAPAVGEVVRAEVELRYRTRPVAAEIEAGPEDTARLRLAEPRIAAPGQAAVFYEGDLLLGGGLIEA
jgi:tRNA-specific 2-thiouridylase